MKGRIAGLLLALGVASTLSSFVVPAKANDYRIEVYNKSSYTVNHIYAANRDEDIGPDVLGRYVIPPGYHMTINVDDGSGYCMFSMRATSDDNAEWERSNFNACEIRSWTLYDSD